MQVKLNRQVQKVLTGKKIPAYIVDQFYFWKESVETMGIASTRKISGWNDHSLKGDRKGQRSVYLNDSWRAIYVPETNEVIEVIEVTNHKY